MAITLDDIKALPPKKKASILALFFLLIGYFYYFFFFQALYEKKAGLDTKLSGLKQQIEAKQLVVKEIQKNKTELIALRENLNLALAKLPDHKEIPVLLSALAMAGRASGLDFVHFEPLSIPKPTEAKPGSKPADKKAAAGAKPGAPPPEAEKFYDEIPIKLILNGGFHDTMGFLESVAKLHRIVNVTEMTMEGEKNVKEEGKVTSTCMMKTYIFVEKSDAKKK